VLKISEFQFFISYLRVNDFSDLEPVFMKLGMAFILLTATC